MPSSNETRAQVAHESERRRRLAVPAFAGGVLYVLSGVIIQAAVRGAPNVGLVQGLAPALHGEGRSPVSPRAAEVKFISHRAFPLIAGSVLAALAIGALVLILLLLFDAARFRRPESWSGARPLALLGGLAIAVVSIANQIAKSVETHHFVARHDFSNHAVDQALTGSTVYQPLLYLGLLASIALTAGMIAIALNAMRVGLLPRWMGMLGIGAGVLFLLAREATVLQVVPGFWMVMMGVLFVGRWSRGDPPAWAAGEARPWPSQAGGRPQREERPQRKAQVAAAGKTPAPAASEAPAAADRPGPDVAPAPVRPSRSARRRRRKRGARR